MRPILTLTTDFGCGDPWAGVMKGVMLSINAEIAIVEITHGVAPQDIPGGALVLADAVPFFPRGTIHVAVVDPGVGSMRRPVAVRAGGCFLVGPDNGLLWPAIERLGGCDEARHITNPEFLLAPVSATFHGRDVFAPAAANLSLGIAPAALGPAIGDLKRLSLPEPLLTEGTLRGEVIHVDAFGNLITNITAQHLGCLAEQGAPVVVLSGVVIGAISRAYSDVPTGQAVALVGSSGRLEIASFQENAAARFGAARGTAVEVATRPRHPSP